MLLIDSGEIRGFDLGAASAVKLTDPKLQESAEGLSGVLSQARSKDRRSIYIDSTGAAAHEMVAQLHDAGGGVEIELPADVRDGGRSRRWRAGRLSITRPATIGRMCKLSVVSGRPISFITQLYEPRYVQRP